MTLGVDLDVVTNLELGQEAPFGVFDQSQLLDFGFLLRDNLFVEPFSPLNTLLRSMFKTPADLLLFMDLRFNFGDAFLLFVLQFAQPIEVRRPAQIRPQRSIAARAGARGGARVHVESKSLRQAGPPVFFCWR